VTPPPKASVRWSTRMAAHLQFTVDEANVHSAEKGHASEGSNARRWT